MALEQELGEAKIVGDQLAKEVRGAERAERRREKEEAEKEGRLKEWEEQEKEKAVVKKKKKRPRSKKRQREKEAAQREKEAAQREKEAAQVERAQRVERIAAIDAAVDALGLSDEVAESVATMAAELAVVGQGFDVSLVVGVCVEIASRQAEATLPFRSIQDIQAAVPGCSADPGAWVQCRNGVMGALDIALLHDIADPSNASRIGPTVAARVDALCR